MLPYPIEIGKEWKITTKKGQGHSRIVGKKDVFLIDRTYRNCLEIHSEGWSVKNGKVESTDYYAPGVGLVKRIAKLNPRGIEIGITMTLRKYSP